MKAAMPLLRIGYAMRPLGLVVTTPWLVGYAAVVDSWCLGAQMVYFTLTMLILVYAVSEKTSPQYSMTCCCRVGSITSFQCPSVVCVNGPLVMNGTTLPIGFVFAMLEAYVQFVWVRLRICGKVVSMLMYISTLTRSIRTINN